MHRYDRRGKGNLIRKYAKDFKLDVLIETGTYKGDMIEEVLEDFREIYTIEIGKDLHEEACKRFRDEKKVHLFLGDSGQVLPIILSQVKVPVLYWLDAHYSGGDTEKAEGEITPVLEEIDAIYYGGTEGSVILIDDARDFRPDWGHLPLWDFMKGLGNRWPKSGFAVIDDIIRVTPPRTGYA